MISDERRRLNAIGLLLNVLEEGGPGVRWCTRCDFVWWACPCMGQDLNERIILPRQESAVAIGRVLGG